MDPLQNKLPSNSFRYVSQSPDTTSSLYTLHCTNTHTNTQPNNVWHCVISECRHNAFTYEYILAFTTKHQWINIYVYKSDFHGLHLVSEQQPPRTTPLYPSRFLCELVNIFRTHPFMLYIIRILVV